MKRPKMGAGSRKSSLMIVKNKVPVLPIFSGRHPERALKNRDWRAQPLQILQGLRLRLRFDYPVVALKFSLQLGGPILKIGII
jgi:hypothetical protein